MHETHRAGSRQTCAVCQIGYLSFELNRADVEVLMRVFRSPLMRLHNLEFENEILKESMAQIYKLRECFEGIFKMRRVVKYSKTLTYSEVTPP